MDSMYIITLSISASATIAKIMCEVGYRKPSIARDLGRIFGRRDLAEVTDLLTPYQGCPEDLQQRFQLTVNRATHLRRKEALDEIFIAHGAR